MTTGAITTGRVRPTAVRPPLSRTSTWVGEAADTDDAQVGELGAIPRHILAFQMHRFLTGVLPDRGFYFLATPYLGGNGFEHFPFTTIDALVEHALTLDAAQRNVYFACASFQQASYVAVGGKKRRRTKENAGWARSFWIDIDCGDSKVANGDGYANAEDAARAVGAFLKTTALPRPTVVFSGGGLHCYWPLSESIDKVSWTSAAERLRSLFELIDPPLLVDHSRTADVASVLRPPGTRNWKPARAGAAVYVVRDAPPIAFTEFTRCVEAALSQTASNPARLRGQPLPAEQLNPQPELMRPVDFSAQKIIANCQQFIWARDNQPDVPEPTWRAMIGTLYRTDAPEIIHDFSSKHPGYTAEETEAKAKAWLGGGVRCAFLETQHPAGCTGCAHKSTIKSPSALGYKGRTAGAVAREAIAEVPEPQNLFETLAPWPLDLVAALPPVLAEFAAVRASVAGHDPTAYAYAAVAAISGVIPHDTRVEVGPTWREPLLQWVAEVGPTGSGKSPAMTAAVEPVVALDQAVQGTYKLARAAWEATKRNGPAPTRSGYYFTDPTIDALIDRAANAQHTVLRHADEGTSWLNAMGRFSVKGDGGERGTWLASWNGAPYTVTRIERGDNSLDAWAVAVLYGITPNKLKEAYADAASDGMLARTLICLTDAARWVPARPDPNVAVVTARYAQAVRAAAATHQLLVMTGLACTRWEALRADYRATALAVAELAPGLSGFLFKAPTMAARLAGLYAVVEGETRVRDVQMERATSFIRHAAMTARIAHEQVFAVSQPVAIARRLAARILTSGGDRIARREFMRTDAYAKASDPERGAAIEHLAGAGWLLEADTKRVRLGPRFREATGWRV